MAANASADPEQDRRETSRRTLELSSAIRTEIVLKDKRIVLLLVLVASAVLAAASLVVSELRAVSADEILGKPEESEVELRLFAENGTTAESTVRLSMDSGEMAQLRQIFEDADPTKRGPKRNLSGESFRVEIRTPSRTTRVDSAGFVNVVIANGSTLYARTPRSARVYDRIAAIIEALKRTHR